MIQNPITVNCKHCPFVIQTKIAIAFRLQERAIVCVVDMTAGSPKVAFVDETTIYRAFGSAVAERRNSIQKTQDRVAREVGLSRASLANIERGKQRVFLHQVLALAEALELTSAHEIVPARAISSRPGVKADVTLSGAKSLSRDQKALVNNIVNALTSNARRDDQ